MPLHRHGLILLGILWLAKLVLAASLPLFGDEAFYWFEAQQLAMAYDDVPLATPWLIALSTAFLGDSWFALRLPFLLLAALSTWLVWQIAMEQSSDRSTAWRAVWIASALPLFAWNGLLALPDVPLTCAVLLALWAGQRLIRQVTTGSCVLLAAAIAMGCLSHYRWVVPLAAAGLSLLLLPEGRTLLALPRIWIAGLAGLVLGWAPLAWQQWQAHGGGLWFQFVERHPWSFQALKLLDPLLQAAVVTPLLYVLLLLAAIRALRSSHHASRWLATAGLALAVLYWVLGWFSDDQRSWAHWPLPAYLALAPLLAARRDTAAARLARWFRWALALAWSCVMLVGGYLAAVVLAPGAFAGSPLYPHNFVGWEAAADETRAALAVLPDETVVVADHFMLAAQLQFALGSSIEVYSLDHPINRKHGRQSVLAALGRDEHALDSRIDGRPWLLVAEQSASSLRQRAAWAARWCARWPNARLLAERSLHHGSKRFIFMLAEDSSAVCSSPAFGYLDARLSDHRQVQGFVVRPFGSVQGVRLRVGERTWGLRYPVTMQDAQRILPAASDPRLPEVGFSGFWPEELGTQPHWVDLEVQLDDGRWFAVASARVDPRE